MKQDFIIVDEVGLHARPATLLVNEMSKFASDGKMIVNDKEANLKSIMGVMALGVAKDATITIEIEGADAQEAMDAISNVIVENGIGESK